MTTLKPTTASASLWTTAAPQVDVDMDVDVTVSVDELRKAQQAARKRAAAFSSEVTDELLRQRF